MTTAAKKAASNTTTPAKKSTKAKKPTKRPLEARFDELVALLRTHGIHLPTELDEPAAPMLVQE